MHELVKSLCCMPKTNLAVCVKYTQIKNFLSKFIERENRLIAALGLVWGHGLNVNGIQVSYWGDENVL